MGYNIAVSLMDTDPDTHPTPANLGIFAAELLTIQFLNNRAEMASDRACETNADFIAARKAEMAGRSPRGVREAIGESRIDIIREDNAARRAAGPSEAERRSLEAILSRNKPEERPQEGGDSTPPPPLSSSDE